MLQFYKIAFDEITVNRVEPALWAKAFAHSDGDVEKAKIYEDLTPLNAKDVAELIFFVATRPRHVNIQDVLVMGTQQASSTNVDRSGRKYE